MADKTLLFHLSDIHFGLEHNRALDWVMHEVAARQPAAVLRPDQYRQPPGEARFVEETRTKGPARHSVRQRMEPVKAERAGLLRSRRCHSKAG